jgi:hypothetical protein
MSTASLRLARSLALTAALAGLAACSGQVQGPSEQDARDAGREYGRAIVDTVGSRVDVAEMESLCGEGVGEDDADKIDAFVDGCREAVAEQ